MNAFVWMLELPTVTGPSWWAGASTWSYDPHEGVRFARKEDAERVRDSGSLLLAPMYAHEVVATEHGFEPAPVSEPVQ